MVNSSPDYAITKPGVRPLSRKRDKPLRTYGRQPTATPEPRSEPQAKRVRTTYAVHDDKNIKPLGIAPLEDDAPTVAPIFKPKPQPSVEEDRENMPPSKPEPNVPAKRSILNYFKPVTTHLTQIKPAKTNIKPVTEPAEEKLSQPAAPKRRLLRIRSQSIESDDDAEEDEDSNAEQREYESSSTVKDEPRPTRKRRLGGGGLVSSDSRRVRRKPASAEVQTTLNISNQAAFSECKICDTVWNPLYPDDVKYHTKRHAAHLRAKKKREDDEF